MVSNSTIDPWQKPTLLSYCCYVRVRQVIPLSHHTSCSLTVKNTLQSKEETDNMPTGKTEQITSGMKGLSFQIWYFL